MSQYNPEKDMPTTLAEWNELIDHFTNKSASEYAEAVAAATASAETAYANLPDSEDKPTLAEYVAMAVSMVPPAQTRADWEQHFRMAGYYPRPAEPPAAAPTLAELKMAKKAELDAAFYTACQHPTVMTSDGWPADANDTAYRNVQGLLITMQNTGVSEVGFCDADNNFHVMNQKELEALQQLIISHGQSLYQRKWELRSAIGEAQDADALYAITISFA